MSSRWLRLNVDWHLSSWLIVLSAESRLAWVQLLCHVKTHGFSGEAKEIAPQAAERLWFVNEPSIRQMLTAAEQAGALVIEDGTWKVANWKRYQGDETHAARQKRYRERQKVTDGDASRDGVTATETETETLKETSKEKFKRPTLEECREQAKAKGIPEEEGEKFWEYNEARDWMMGKSRMKNWKQGFATWARNYRERNPQKESEWVV